jgi:hypothetical protein
LIIHKIQPAFYPNLSQTSRRVFLIIKKMKLYKSSHPLTACMVMSSLLLAVATTVKAADRPFLETDTAMVEDDDERTFEFSAWLVKLKQERALQAALEYNFNPTLSAEVELGWLKNKEDGSRERSVELGLRKVWIDPAREGWGLGSNVNLGWSRTDEHGWKYQSLRAVMTYSLPLLEKQIWLHANAGLLREQDELKTYGIWSLAAQARLRKDISLFTEYAHQAQKSTMVQGGVRWWAKKDKLALDFAVGQQRPQDADRQNFINVGLSFYDLDYK